MIAALVITTVRRGRTKLILSDPAEANFWFSYFGISLFVFLLFRFLSPMIESGRKLLRNLSNHQGYKRLSVFVPCVVFVMVWTLLPSIEDHLHYTDDLAWISGLSALFAALSLVAVKGIHWVTDGFNVGTVEKPETKRREPDVSDIEISEKPEVMKREPEVSKKEVSATLVQEHKKGWKPLPTLLKVLFVYGILGLVLGAFSIPGALSIDGALQTGGVSIFGLYIPGDWAAVTFFISSLVGSIVLLLAMWNRSTWAWKYGCAYFGFFILNGLLGLRNISEVLDARLASEPLAAEPFFSQFMYLSAFIGTLSATAINVMFGIVLFKNRSYFK